MFEKFEKIGEEARAASLILAGLSADEKNALLISLSEALRANADKILSANKADLDDYDGELRDRLMLNERRVHDMADAVLSITKLPDPVGEVLEAFERPNGLRVRKERVPLGVIGIIYEARPNVTTDAAALCFKSGNAVILRGGKEAIRSNIALTEVMRTVLPANAVQLISDTSREAAAAFMRLHTLDAIVPRGGAELIRAVRENAAVPVIETGTGNCHIYVEKTADLDMAERIIVNAKCSRPTVCNACEKLLIDRDIADLFLLRITQVLRDNGVNVLTENVDWYEEYLGLTIGVKVVGGVDEAVEHINRYSSKHSEAVVTSDEAVAERFTRGVDSACVYVNASTRFTDGGEFGFGAELGISTQKLHARGPVGLRELTSYKYIIIGEGQTR